MKNKSSGKNLESYTIFIISALIILSFLSTLVAAPPTPHSVNGYIKYSNDSQVSLNTGYTINVSNATSTIFFKQSKTSFPLLNFSGYYSESVSGTDGDNLTIIAWSATNYSITTLILAGTMSGINVTLNLSRDPEPTVNITFPNDNVLRNDSTYFSVITNLTLYGQNSNNCKAEISFTNNTVLSMYNSQLKIASLGELTTGDSILYTWNISGINVGSSNITINFTCDSMFGTKFEILNFTDTLFNVTIQDTTPPNITLFNPLNNTKTQNSTLSFSYNVIDTNKVQNCSLYINGTFKQMNNSITNYTTLFFDEIINQGINIWQVKCEDEYKNLGFSKNFIITKDTNTRTIYSEFQNYTQGFYARFVGYNWTTNSNITLTITKSTGLQIIRTLIATNGIINTTFFINYSDPIGTYNFSAYETNYSFYNASSNVTIHQRVQVLSINKNNYNHYENITITGFNFTINGTVNVRIFLNNTNSTGYRKNVTSNSSGNFYLIWNVSTICQDVYGITVRDLNYTNYSETIYFNITGGTPCINWGNTLPNVTDVIIDDIFISPINEINLLAATTTHVYCNFSAIDIDGFSDIVNANATLYYYLNKSSDLDNNSTHYTNPSCLEISNDGINTKQFTCGFDIYYYSNNGTWICNASAYDSQGFGYSNDSTKLLDLIALNITPIIDYGNVPTGNISSEINSIVTNFGNIKLNLNISAYGVTPNDGIALNCTQNNISLKDEKYTLTSGTSFASMISVTSTPALISFNLLKQSNQSLAQKNLFWRIQPTQLSYGNCQGTIVVTAVGG